MTAPPRPPTATDVARRAGVSQPTVSLVLGGNPQARVSAATRERVLRAADELGYRPNVLARGLKSRRSYALGVIVSDLRNPFYVDVVSGVERVVSEESYAVLLCDAREVGAERHVEALVARQIDGVILDGSGAASLEASHPLANVVLVDEPSDRFPAVVSDAPSAGRLAGEHLIGLGHRRLGFIGPATALSRFRLRERGWVDALRAAGLSIPSEWLRRAAPTAAGGEAAMRALLGLERRPTGVFCANDLVAAGAVKACVNAGVAVPSEVSIVGCDDLELARLMTPELTTVSIPARELGARAARLLLERMEGREGRVPRPLPVRLVVRGTTAPPPPAAEGP